MSIICSALQWLIDRREKQKSENKVESGQNCAKGGEFDSDDEPDWMRNFVASKDTQDQDKKSKKNKFRVGIGTKNLAKKHISCSDLSSKGDEIASFRKKEGNNTANNAVELNEDEFLLEE